MIARLLISSSLEIIKTEVVKILAPNPITYPDVLYFSSESKLGISEARKIKEHFSLKPYSAKGRLVVLENASGLTPEAQNALLKTLEELPKEALLILGANSDSHFLPTVLSRCLVVKLQGTSDKAQGYEGDLERLETASIAERFEFIEKLKDKENFLKSLIEYFHQKRKMAYLKEILQAEEWAKQNVNIRAILEYLMLVMPNKL